jgi:beta-lactamase regulating signal transducer with metallopeptidase domain
MEITLISCMVKPVVASGILYLYYLLVLRNRKFHAYNRFYLLFTILISMIVPFVDFGWISIEAPAAISFDESTPQAANAARPFFTAGTWLLVVMGTVSCLLLLSVMLRIAWIYRVKRKGKITAMQGYTFIETGAKEAPFSFLDNLFWKQGLSVTDANGEKIWRHELAHISQKHTYDKLFTQIMCCLLWINPFFWLIQKELNVIHEFLADAASVEDGDTEAFARMLLYSHNQGSYLSPSHSFFNSSIKRRLIMITTSNKTPYSFARRILALPIALFVLATLSITLKAQTTKGTGQEPQKSGERAAPVSGKKVEKKGTPAAATEQKADQQPVTVIGYKSVKKNPPATPAKQKADLEPITVSGYKTERKGTATTPAEQKADQEPIIVSGYKKVEGKLIPAAATEQKTNQEPIIVSGYKKVEGKLIPAAATEQKVAEEKEVTIIAHKAEKKAAPSAATEQKAEQKEVIINARKKATKE